MFFIICNQDNYFFNRLEKEKRAGESVLNEVGEKKNLD